MAESVVRRFSSKEVLESLFKKVAGLESILSKSILRRF